jgi:biopolymer transport protein ExbB
VLRLRDTASLDETNLANRIKSRKDQTTYLGNQIDEYARGFDSRLHVSEVQRYGELIQQKMNSAANSNLSDEEKFAARLDLLNLSLERLEEGIGGVVFEGSAVDNVSGVVADGKFLVLGPIGYFASRDSSIFGLAEMRHGSSEPAVLALPPESNPAAIAETVSTLEGPIPVDSTRGSAFKVEETKKTILEEFQVGGPVMWPIGGLGALAVLIGFFKWIQLSRVKRPSYREVSRFLENLDKGNGMQAEVLARKTTGPIGKMLMAAVSHYNSPSTVLEESMFERVLDARTSLNSWTPFIKIAAAVEPLLGLLGTVTGMINTFKLITVFGTGDSSTFSAGISEALLTTQWGLITAIPCLLIAAFLGRMAKAAMDDMEKLGVRIMNHRKAKDADKEGEPPEETTPAVPAAPQPTTPRRAAPEGPGPEEGGAPGMAPSPA